jgi:pyruvate dehydrogenase E1 component
VACGAVTPEAIEAHRQMLEDVPGAGLLVVTSPDRLYADWRAAGREGALIHRLLAPLAPQAALVSVIDGHPAALSWLGGVRGQRIRSLGIDHFGQSGDIPDLYRAYGLDSDAILDAAAGALLG